MNDYRVEAGSFRDRHGRVIYQGDRVLRCLSEQAADNWRVLRDQEFFLKGIASGSIVNTRELQGESMPEGPWSLLLEHDRLPLISYPYEWSFGMLREAALLQLDLTDQAVAAGMMLKDASAYNVQWNGTTPVFIDIPSFEPMAAGSVWTGYRQFCQLFLYPLLLQSYREIPFQPLLRGMIDGVPPEMANHLFSLRDRMRSGVFTHVYLQSKLQSRYSSTARDVRSDVRSAGFGRELIRANLRGMRKLVSGLKWQPAGSEWGDYRDFHNYTDDDHRKKAEFVEQSVSCKPRRQVWDLGANTGQFSRIAADSAEYVLAADIDQLAVERNYRSLVRDGIKNILPLTMNLGDPSPGLGWQLTERKPLIDRGRPDLVLCLALIHHLVITANLPLGEVVGWLASLGSDLVIEFVSKDDDKVRSLLNNKDDQYDDYELENFERLLSANFRIAKKLELESGNRTLYLAETVA